MSCKNCKYFDENETSGSKGYCEWHRTYVYEDDNCNRFEKRDSSGGCFITSACCNYKGFPDNCYELTVLRKYRDTFLKKTKHGKDLINEYYRIAPSIVECINSHPDKETIYSDIYERISKCVSLIEKNELEIVCKLYEQMVTELKSKYYNN